MSVDEFKVDHGLVEAAMAQMPRDQRAAFWTDHIDVLSRAMIERGISELEVETILSDHFRRVRELHHRAASKRLRRPAIDLEAAPPVGAEILIGRRMAKLIESRPYVRKDGAQSFVLVWMIEGALFTSGLRTGLYRVKEGSEYAQ